MDGESVSNDIASDDGLPRMLFAAVRICTCEHGCLATSVQYSSLLFHCSVVVSLFSYDASNAGASGYAKVMRRTKGGVNGERGRCGG